MKLSYDRKANIAYLRFHEKRGTVTTLKISGEMNIDIAPDRTVYGIERSDSRKKFSRDLPLVPFSDGSR